MDIQAAEISAILKEQIKGFGSEAEVSEIGQVLSVGDGIARVYGLDNVQAGEMVEFPGGIKGMALNLEADNVGVAFFDRAVIAKDHDTDVIFLKVKSHALNTTWEFNHLTSLYFVQAVNTGNTVTNRENGANF